MIIPSDSKDQRQKDLPCDCIVRLRGLWWSMQDWRVLQRLVISPRTRGTHHHHICKEFRSYTSITLRESLATKRKRGSLESYHVKAESVKTFNSSLGVGECRGLELCAFVTEYDHSRCPNLQRRFIAIPGASTIQIITSGGILYVRPHIPLAAPKWFTACPTHNMSRTSSSRSTDG